jgi:hypothetical protein
VNVIVFTIHLDQFSLEVGANFGEDMSQSLDRLAIQATSARLGHEGERALRTSSARRATSPFFCA